MMRNNKILEIVLILLCLVGMASLLILVVYRFQIVPFAKKDDENLLHYFYILLFMSTGIQEPEWGKSKECIYPADRGWKPPLYAKSRCAKTGLYIPDEPHNHRKYLPRHGLCQDLPVILFCFE